MSSGSEPADAAADVASSLGTKGVARPERERQIVAAAITEFADRGYRGASVAAIASAAGISKPLVYQYFGSKEGLFLACLHAVAGGLLERLEAASAAEDDSLLARVGTLHAVFAALEPQREAWHLLYDSSMPGSGPISEVVGEYRHRTEQVALRGSARFLHARGSDDRLDADALSAVWLALVDAVVRWWLAHPEESATAMTARCERLMRAVTTAA